MKYIVATFNLDCCEELFQTACDLLMSSITDAGFEAFEDCDGGFKAYAQESLFNQKMLDEEIASFMIANVSISYTTEKAEDKDWNEDWENTGFEPINIDGRCTIYDAKHTDATLIATEGGVAVLIEAKQSFGTGTHQTTRMVVSELLKLNLTGKSVLDCGCGTGILGITSSKFGAEKVFAYDVDNWCIENTKHNAQLNNVSNIEVREGCADILKDVDMQVDVVVANINRNILLADMPAFHNKMKSGAILIMSGFYEADIPMILDKAESLSMTKVAQQASDEWACVVVKKC